MRALRPPTHAARLPTCAHAHAGHCESWVGKFTGLLGQMAVAELRSLHQYFREGRAALSTQPASLEQLAELVGLHRK